MVKVSLLAPILLTAAVLLPAHAQNATTTPVGVVTVQLDANKKTALSLPLEKSPIASGNVTAVTAATISDSAATLPALSTNHFVRIKSGNAAGRNLRITSNTGTTMTVETGVGSWALPVDSSGNNTVSVAVGDKYEIVPMWTLGEVFGSNSTTSVLRTATNPNSADQITVYSDGTVQAFFNNGTNWRNAASSSDTNNYNSYGLLPTGGIWVTRRSTGTNAELQFTGNVVSTAARMHMPGGNRFGQSIPYASRATLGTLSLASLSSWTKNNNPNNADQVTIYRPDNTVGSYFVNAAGVWRNALSSLDTTDYTNTEIPAGSGLWITRRGAATGSTANVNSTLPYSLQ